MLNACSHSAVFSHWLHKLLGAVQNPEGKAGRRWHPRWLQEILWEPQGLTLLQFTPDLGLHPPAFHTCEEHSSSPWGNTLWAETLAKPVGWGGAEYTSSAWAHSLKTYNPFWSSTWALTTSILTIDNFGEQHKCWNGSEALNHWERKSLESIQKLTPSTVHRQYVAGLFPPSKAHTLSVKPHHTERASSRLAWWNAAMVEAAAVEAAMGAVIKSYYNLTQLARQILS